MTATDRRARSVPLLVSGMAVGALLAVLTASPGGGSLAPLAMALPFFLAGLTGVAKTTTA
jgi:hypothetical protein